MCVLRASALDDIQVHTYSGAPPLAVTCADTPVCVFVPCAAVLVASWCRRRLRPPLTPLLVVRRLRTGVCHQLQQIARQVHQLIVLRCAVAVPVVRLALRNCIRCRQRASKQGCKVRGRVHDAMEAASFSHEILNMCQKWPCMSLQC